MRPTSIAIKFALAFANKIQFGKRLAKRTIIRKQQAMRPVFFIGRFGHGTKGVIFLV